MKNSELLLVVNEQLDLLQQVADNLQKKIENEEVTLADMATEEFLEDIIEQNEQFYEEIELALDDLVAYETTCKKEAVIVINEEEYLTPHAMSWIRYKKEFG